MTVNRGVRVARGVHVHAVAMPDIERGELLLVHGVSVSLVDLAYPRRMKASGLS
jgi:hypothetical protein